MPSVCSVPPFICLDILRQELRSSAAAPTWISLSPPVGTCAGHFRSRFRRAREGGRDRERLSMRKEWQRENFERERKERGRRHAALFLRTLNYLLRNPCFLRTLLAIIRCLWSTDNSSKGGVGGIIRYCNSKTDSSIKDILQLCLPNDKRNDLRWQNVLTICDTPFMDNTETWGQGVNTHSRVCKGLKQRGLID